MRINVALIGYLEAVGLPGGFAGGPVELAEGARVDDLLRAIGAPLPTPNLITRTGQKLNGDEPLRDGDTISVVPPIGGGSR